MQLNEIPWVYPCGCGDTPHPRAEIQLGGGHAVRIKVVDGEYYVQRFGPQGALNKDANGVPQYEAISGEELAKILR